MYYAIKLIDKVDKNLLESIKQDQQDHQGLMELYDQLIGLGSCESYSLDRINIVTKTLKDSNIQVKATKVDS